MAKTKIISLLLTFTLILSFLPQCFVFAADNDKEFRNVYLHAQQGEYPPQSAPNVSTVYKDDTFNLYFAVDNPNKGDYEDGKHIEPQYDMNGYTVKIYFDSSYFDFAPTQKTTAARPIDYTIPDKSITSSGTGDGNDNIDTGGNPDDVQNIPQDETVGYYVYSLGSGSEMVNNKIYNTAFATIFFSGNFLPQRKDGQFWYNLCALPLNPLKTGSTDVFIEIGTADEYTLELFAKDVSNKYSPTFNFTAVNSGYHHITIKDKLKPSEPVADPVSGTYTEAQKVKLIAEDGCNIYYSIDGGVTYSPYTEPIDVERSMEISAYAERRSDGKKSNTVGFEYKIVPKPPHLFDSDKKAIAPVYTEDDVFYVYVSDKEVYGNIADGSEVYYTFADLSIDDLTADDGTDPESEWVKVLKGTELQKIKIDKNRTVKLVTVKSSIYATEYSDISWYYLGIKPAAVTANPGSGIYDEKKNVVLETVTSGADIYYTINGKDPRTEGVLYTVPLALNKDTTVRSAAWYDGQWSELSSFWYVFNLEDDYGVDAFYPSGVYEGEVNVTLTPNNPDNSIVYSTDGGKTWDDYTDTITISKDTEILAKAVDKSGKEGEIYKFSYTIKPLPPEFAPESTQFTNTDKITVYCIERTDDNYSDYELYYTLDGSDPTTSKTAKMADEVSDSVVIEIIDYTVVKAVVKRDKTTFSTVVTHSYDIVVSKPVKPLTTLLPGYYTREIGSEPYTTQFVPVPDGTNIYYTISHGDEAVSDPVPGADGTYEYKPGEEIELKGRTIIKAVAVNSFGAKSDIGIFEYVITPEAPVAAPSATIGGNKLPVVPVDAVEGSTVKYEIGDFENKFVAENERFYINTSTGNAYEDEECTKPLGEKNDKTNTGMVVLVISAELDEISSEPNTYIYAANNKPETLAPPYADKETGIYEEIKVAEDDNTLLIVSLYSLNDGDEIEYMKDNDGKWVPYEKPLKLKVDTVLQLRSKKGDNYSTVSTYVYEFVPLAPIITLPSGRYSTTPELPTTTLKRDSRAPTDVNYTIMYRTNGDKNDVPYTEGTEREIEHTMSFKAYVVNDDTGKKSKNTIHYYIIESNAQSGSVYTAYPYEVNPGDTKYISSHLLSEAPYNQGIKLYTQNKDAKIRYFYTYTKADGSGSPESEIYTYDNETPIFVNSSMSGISITAWLIDSDGNEIEDSTSTFNYVFVDLGIPVPSLEDVDETEFPMNTDYTIRDYPNEENIFIYYTLDGSDPADSDNENRKLYNGETLKLTESTTVKTVYFSACGGCGQCKDDEPQNCTRGVYGKTGTYKYSVIRTISGGGGGGGGGTVTIDKTRKYTKDIFGNEHPTHIGYIKGYPDGSVRPDGSITREEMTTILYRIKNRQYESPFASTGNVFPDVNADRWSVTEIEYMADRGFVKGYPDGKFKPARSLTRAEFAALVFRFTEIDDSKTKYVFSDLEGTHWAYDEIMALCDAGLMEGYEDGTFKPENNISRAEVMTVVNKILGRNPSESYVKSLDFNPFNDLFVSKWYYVTVLEATITHNYYLDDKGVEYKWEDWK